MRRAKIDAEGTSDSRAIATFARAAIPSTKRTRLPRCSSHRMENAARAATDMARCRKNEARPNAAGVRRAAGSPLLGSGETGSVTVGLTLPHPQASRAEFNTSQLGCAPRIADEAANSLHRRRRVVNENSR
jgi:hypothetical protein